MTATQHQWRRGSAAQLASFAGSAGEIVVDTTNWRVVVCDGTTAGGHPMASTNGANVWTNTQTFQPPANSLTQAFNVVASLPASGTSSVGFNVCEIDVTNPGYATTGVAIDSFGLLPNITALRVNLTSQGAAGGGPCAIVGAMRGTAASPNIVGITGSGYTNFNSSHGDAIWGTIGFSNLGPSASSLVSFGVDAESAIATGGSALYRFGCTASSLTAVQGSTLDVAFGMMRTPTFTGASPYTPTLPWKYGYTFLTAYTGVAPLSSTGSCFYSDAAFNVGTIFDLSNITPANYYFNLGKFVQTAAGNLTVTGSSGGNVILATCASGGIVAINAAANGTSGFDGIQIEDSSTNNNLVLVTYEASWTAASRFGITNPGNYAAVLGQGSTNLGLLVGTTVSSQLIFGTNNTKAGFIDTSQRWFIGSGGQFTTFGGSLTPQALVTATLNAGTPTNNPAAGTIVWLVGQDGAHDNTLTLDQYGAGVASNSNVISFREGGGTAASPSATASGTYLGIFRFSGYTGSAFYRTAALLVQANENFSGTAGGADLQWFTTPNTTQAVALAVTFKASGGVAIGTSTDPAIGGLIFNGQLYGPNISTTASAANAFINTGSSPAGQLLRSTSSLRYKTDVRPLDVDDLKAVLALSPIRFRSLSEADDPDAEFVGLAAEDVADVLPSFVYRDPQGRPDGVQYDRLAAVALLAVVKDQQRQIDELKNRVRP